MGHRAKERANPPETRGAAEATARGGNTTGLSAGATALGEDASPEVEGNF